MGKYINVGIGVSTNKDGYKAAKEAAEKALKECGGRPTFSFVFFTGNYDVEDVNKGFKEKLRNIEFVGGSVDGVISDGKLFDPGVGVLTISSEYMHFGVGSLGNIRKDFVKAAQKTTRKAVDSVPVDKYVDPYLQYSRLKRGKLSDFIKIPSFFVIAFTTGFKLDRFGNEDLLIEGISNIVGNFIPIFGGSLGNDMDKVFKNEPYEIYILHSGEILKDGIAVIFVNTGLLYSNSLAHGVKATDKVGYISKVSHGGFVVEEISGKNIIKWYAEMIDVSEEEFRKNILYYTQYYPLGFPDGFGNIVMRAGGVPYGKNALSYIAPFKENTPVFLMKVGDEKDLMKVSETIKNEIEHHLQKSISPELTFLASCSSRRRIMKENKYKKELELLSKTFNSRVFGFSSFGEIGAKPAQASRFNHLCINVLNIYDRLIV